jgi:hypothetical protein
MKVYELMALLEACPSGCEVVMSATDLDFDGVVLKNINKTNDKTVILNFDFISWSENNG